MYIRINGALILARGGSMIPMEELDGWTPMPTLRSFRAQLRGI
jgi:hypothetical protein